ncbi:MAG: EamA family transporter RarD [Hyphomonadaceae bacterium]|nr:MAG: chloramphenicol-sensitive protein RarD [Caulobacteraceae bacterium]MBT9446317.1 EamA family transporter RarD [Hyphomonadaceae bacterium]TPW07997.1 MAG: chloramphenicol-sensitive protein RarD [Alphaproteobacteria bacterium]
MNQPSPDVRAGFIAAASAYGVWGVLPLYLKLVGFAGPWEVLCARILWSVPAATLAVLFMGGFAETRVALKQPGVLGALFLSSVFIAVNWAIYVWAVANHHVIEASLAYFLTPLVNVAFGVTLFKERLTGAQAGALALAAVGIAVQAYALGAFPWVSIALCATWSCYGLVRKQAPVPAAGGLLAETMILAIPAALGLWWLSTTAKGLTFDDSVSNALLLAASGLATAVPLILFSFGARRLKFSTLGMLQFMAPSIQFFIGWAYGEPLTALRIASFVLIWIGLALFTADAMWRERQRVALSS